MTRKDYQVLAVALGKALAVAERVDEPNWTSSTALGCGYAIDQLVVALAAENPRFSVAIFEAAVFEARDSEAARYAEWEKSRVFD